jgi:hypothetical protein
MGSEHVDVAASTWQGLHALTRLAEGRGVSWTIVRCLLGVDADISAGCR